LGSGEYYSILRKSSRPYPITHSERKWCDFRLRRRRKVRFTRCRDIVHVLREMIVHLRENDPGCPQRRANFSRNPGYPTKLMRVTKSRLRTLFEAIHSAGTHRFLDRVESGSVCADFPWGSRLFL
jgi:hypothetical protein